MAANPIPASNSETSHKHPLKRPKQTNNHHNDHHVRHEQPIIPGLPDHLAQLCLSLVPPALLFSVCHSWRRLIYSPDFPPFLSLYTILSSTNTQHDNNNHASSIHFFAYDPISSRWDCLPPPSDDPPLRFLLRHPSFISRNLPIQSVSVSGLLVLLAATSDNFNPALSRPLVFNPISRKWSFGPPLDTPRRWCATGTTQGIVYVASGIGSHFSTDVAKSVEKWEPQRINKDGETQNQKENSDTNNSFSGWSWKWEKVKGLKDARFSRDAVDAVGWRGKLCMVNMKGDAAKEGIVYDTQKEDWENMPKGMLAGWKGPVATMNEEVMYVVDERKGALRTYDPERDKWENIIKSERLRGAQQIAAEGGRVCVLCGGSDDGIVVVDMVSKPVRMRVIETPPGFEAVAVHILPRMSKPDAGFFPGSGSTSTSK
ncbi:hypothetical protein K2173_009542 [Erythroxylum novogranatense]|uniref:F-box/kelch-repeat protein SKIP25 n=1 Tax=Erythroxylum novogranatense TaxID=1862640 RepID=A0AAV8U495_9ROSI|nr:hypothetical protein K2173_009542 [Erythroxylum novogranatense]